MHSNDYPALYRAANLASANAQREYLLLIRIEFGLLIAAAVLALNLSGGRVYYALEAVIILAALGIMFYRSLKKPEQDWYKCRALAESIKTLTWRYMMRAEPFGDDWPREEARGEFVRSLRQSLSGIEEISHRIEGLSAAENQITPHMNTVRFWDCEQRHEHYEDNRIIDQRKWYSREASSNRRRFRFWMKTAATVYITATLLVLGRVVWPDWTFTPTGPLLVAAAGIVGWTQIKKFNELASAYALTAHEIGLIHAAFVEANTEEKLSDFVNEAELAFSREHTQWVARQRDF